MRHSTRNATVAATALAFFPALAHAGVGDPWADEVVEHDFGSGGGDGFDDPTTVLGSPERFTGEGVFPSVVSPFSPPFGTDEIVSIGAGGFITVAFDQPVLNDSLNPYGIDLIVFSNTGFIDQNFPNGVVGGVFGNDGGTIEVSADGVDWRLIENVPANGLFPSLGYLDSGPYDETPGDVPSDFTRPVDPSLTLEDFMGLPYEEVLALYDGSGGGTGVDIGSVGLEEIRFVRIAYSGNENIEIDGFSDVAAVPGPGALAILGLAGAAGRGRRRR